MKFKRTFSIETDVNVTMHNWLDKHLDALYLEEKLFGLEEVNEIKFNVDVVEEHSWIEQCKKIDLEELADQIVELHSLVEEEVEEELYRLNAVMEGTIDTRVKEKIQREDEWHNQRWGWILDERNKLLKENKEIKERLKYFEDLIKR